MNRRGAETQRRTMRQRFESGKQESRKREKSLAAATTLRWLFFSYFPTFLIHQISAPLRLSGF